MTEKTDASPILSFPEIRQQVNGMMRYFREWQERNSKTAALMAWYGRHDKPEPPTAA